MGLIDALINLAQNKKTLPSNHVPEGVCPNCWGKQEWDGHYFEAMINDKVDIKTLSSNRGWVQKYADRYLHAVTLRLDHEDAICDYCKRVYKRADLG